MASDSLGWTWTTGTEREVVVGLEGVPVERERAGQSEKWPKKRFLEKRLPTQTLPIGRAAAATAIRAYCGCCLPSSRASSSAAAAGAWHCSGGTGRVPPGDDRRWGLGGGRGLSEGIGHD